MDLIDRFHLCVCCILSSRQKTRLEVWSIAHCGNAVDDNNFAPPPSYSTHSSLSPPPPTPAPLYWPWRSSPYDGFDGKRMRRSLRFLVFRKATASDFCGNFWLRWKTFDTLCHLNRRIHEREREREACMDVASRLWLRFNQLDLSVSLCGESLFGRLI